MGEVIRLVEPDGSTLADHEPDEILTAAIGQDFRSVVVIGACQDRSLYLAADTSDLGTVLILLERARASIVAMLEP
jgi:hypothetical protein